MYHSSIISDPAGCIPELTYYWLRGPREPIVCTPPSLASRDLPSCTVVDDVDGGWDEMSGVDGD